MIPLNRKIITEIELGTGEHKRRFALTLPPASDGYREITSYNGFFNGGKKANYSPKYLYHAQEEEFYRHRLKFRRETFPDHPEPDIIEVRDLWHLYELIGFDHKTRKYNDVTSGSTTVPAKTAKSKATVAKEPRAKKPRKSKKPSA